MSPNLLRLPLVLHYTSECESFPYAMTCALVPVEQMTQLFFICPEAININISCIYNTLGRNITSFPLEKLMFSDLIDKKRIQHADSTVLANFDPFAFLMHNYCTPLSRHFDTLNTWSGTRHAYFLSSVSNNKYIINTPEDLKNILIVLDTGEFRTLYDICGGNIDNFYTAFGQNYNMANAFLSHSNNKPCIVYRTNARDIEPWKLPYSPVIALTRKLFESHITQDTLTSLPDVPICHLEMHKLDLRCVSVSLPISMNLLQISSLDYWCRNNYLLKNNRPFEEFIYSDCISDSRQIYSVKFTRTGQVVCIKDTPAPLDITYKSDANRKRFAPKSCAVNLIDCTQLSILCNDSLPVVKAAFCHGDASALFITLFYKNFIDANIFEYINIFRCNEDGNFVDNINIHPTLSISAESLESEVIPAYCSFSTNGYKGSRLFVTCTDDGECVVPAPSLTALYVNFEYSDFDVSLHSVFKLDVQDAEISGVYAKLGPRSDNPNDYRYYPCVTSGIMHETSLYSIQYSRKILRLHTGFMPSDILDILVKNILQIFV